MNLNSKKAKSISEKIQTFDFSVNDMEYTDILELTFFADLSLK